MNKKETVDIMKIITEDCDIHYVAVIPNYWARGKSPQEAAQNLLDSYGKKSDLATISTVISPKGALEPYVTGLGSICYVGMILPHLTVSKLGLLIKK